MARERAKLTEKEERILIQAQLMGLTTASMVKIGNRLKAIEREAEQRRDIDTVMSRFTYEGTKDVEWRVTSEDKTVYHFTNRQNKYSRNWNHNKEIFWDVQVTKPGTRFEPRFGKAQKIYISNHWPAKLCPEKNKELFALISGIGRSTWDNLPKA